MVKKTFLLFLMIYSCFFSALQATRYCPRFNRTACRILCDATPKPLERTDASIYNIIDMHIPGNYQLYDDLEDIQIQITVDGVHLDLNGHKISHSNEATNIIEVASNDVTIFNGRIVGQSLVSTKTGSGIYIDNGICNVQIRDVVVSNCGNGIQLAGTYGSEIEACIIETCDLISNTTGLVLNYADANIIRACAALKSTQAGFELIQSEGNFLKSCQAIKTSGSQSAMGFVSLDGRDNLFENCVAKETQTSAWEFYDRAYGFLLTGTEEKTKIIDCIVNDTDMTSTVSAVAYGIQLDPILLEGSSLLYHDFSATPGAVVLQALDWCPRTQYLATGDDDERVDVYRFCMHNMSLHFIDDDATPTGVVNSVDWCPCGKYLAEGDSSGTANDGYVRVYSFDGSILTHIVGDNTARGNVNSVAWSPNGKYILEGDSGDDVRIYSFDGFSLVVIDEDGTANANVYSVSWSPGGKYFTSGDAGNYVRVWLFDGGTITHLVGNNASGADVNSVAWSPDGMYIASGDAGNVVRVWRFDGNTLEQIDSDSTPTDVVNSVSWSPDGKYIASGGADDTVRIFRFDGLTLTQVKSVTTPPNADITAVTWAPCGRHLSTCAGAYIDVFDAMRCPQNCLIKDCTVCDTTSYGQVVGTGIASGGMDNSFLSNACCNNEVNFTYGVPNVFYGNHNIQRNTVKPFDNISEPATL